MHGPADQASRIERGDAEASALTTRPLLENLLACIAGRLLLHFPEHDFLRQFAGALITPLPEEPRQLAEQLAQVTEHLLQMMDRTELRADPLVRVMRCFGLSPFELDLVLLALAPELDERFGDLYAGVNGGLRRLVMHQALPLLIADSTERRVVRDRLRDSALWRCGLMLDDSATPLFERRLQVGVALSDFVAGRSPLASAHARLHRPEQEPQAITANGLLRALNEQAQELAGWSASAAGERMIVHLVGRAAQLERCADALSLAMRRPWLGLTTGGEGLTKHASQLLVAARLAGALPVLEIDPAAAGDIVLSESDLAPLSGAMLIAAPDAVVLRTPAAITLRRWVAPSPRPLELARVWQHYLDAVGGSAEIDLLANQTHLGVERIAAVIELACTHAAADGRAGPGHDDVLRALRETVPDPMSRLATSHRPQVPWSVLVLDRKSKSSLEGLVQRVRYRVEVQDRWGLGAARYGGRGNGLVALLHGESGTGKTFAAQAVASRLGLPVLNVDLSRVVSKYIGETEKHLNELFDLGEGFRALLFFDEADALFGKRTGVKDAHDRYANIEVNFLLQRLETFDGIVLLASNFQQSMDDAFTRRIGFSVFFPRPTPGQRLALWHQHLPRERLTEDVRLERVAERYELVGGEIRNCALSAAYAAAAEGGSISQRIIETAIVSEFTKMGRPPPRGILPPK